MVKDDGSEPSSSKTKTTSTSTRGRPRKSHGGRKSAPSKKPEQKASEKRSKSADWADVQVNTHKEFKPMFDPNAVLTEEQGKEWMEIVEKAAEETIRLKTNAAKEEFNNLFSDDEEEDGEKKSEHTESEFDEEDEDASSDEDKDASSDVDKDASSDENEDVSSDEDKDASSDEDEDSTSDENEDVSSDEDKDASSNEDEDSTSDEDEDSTSDPSESGAPKLVRSAPPIETESIKMNYFEPISKNVKGRNEYQLSNTPLINEQTVDMAICSGVYKVFENGIHGYLEETFESSPEIIFNVMTKILQNKDANFHPDFFYYAMYRVFPNTGCQKEMAEMYPQLVKMFAKEEDQQELLDLECWKTGEVEKEERPLDYKHPLSRGNYFVKTITLAHDANSCSQECYKRMSMEVMERLLERFDVPNNVLTLYLGKSCTSDEAPFLNKLMLNDEEEMVADFCAVAKEFPTRSCAEWAKKVIELAKPTAVQEKPKSHQEKYEQFCKKTANDMKLDMKEFKKKKEENGGQGTFDESAVLETCKQFKPCCHFGPCGPDVPDCSCGRVCSVYCQCDDNCPQKYPGCTCSPNKCSARSCLCRKMLWECIEGACNTCLKSTASNPEPWCQNHLMTLRKGKIVECKKSTIAGNGAFLGEDVEKDDYLGDYAGEHIGEEETERRGKVYELSTCYLFSLPWRQGCIDAGRAGNIFRFVNHSAKPNCYVVTRIVRGKPIIGFFAKKRMVAGTELTFDYDYSKEHAIKYFESKPEDRVPKFNEAMIDSPLSSPSPSSSSPSPPQPPRKKRRQNDSDDDANQPSTSTQNASKK